MKTNAGQSHAVVCGAFIALSGVLLIGKKARIGPKLNWMYAPRMKQLQLIPAEKPEHGGELYQGERKTLRPLATDRPIHLILKAKMPFPGSQGAEVLREAWRLAEKFFLRIYDHAVSDDHVHFVLKIPHRRDYLKFIRALTGLLSRRYGKGFWLRLPYTRVAHWGSDYKNLGEYLEKNRLEAAGELPYKDRFFREEDFFA